MNAASNSTGTRFKSVGLGWDYRFEVPRLVGSALEHDGTVIHMASFKVDEADKVPSMAGCKRRRAPFLPSKAQNNVQ